ncbi:MAG: cupin domain-containing protein [Thermomicrobiales bacterium]
MSGGGSRGLGTDAAPGGAQWARYDDLPEFSPAPGLRLRMVAGDQMMSCWNRIDPNVTLAAHSHPNEQLGVIIEGAVTVTIGGETRRLTPGMAYVVPAAVEHDASTGPEGVLLIESFAPVRQGFVDLARAAREG